jgi:type III secretory pathway component EscT
MIDRPANRRQLDLLARAAKALEPSRIPPPLRAEVTFLLKLLMAEHIAADVALPVEATDE